jgi:hypothetical protein
MKPCVLLPFDGRFGEKEFVLVLTRKAERKFEKDVVDHSYSSTSDLSNCYKFQSIRRINKN